MEQHKNEHSEIDVHKYYGKSVDYVIKELEKQGYTSIQYDTHRLVQGRPLSPIPISTIVQVYVDSFTNTVHQIIMKH